MARKTLTTIDEVIRKLGGPAAVVALTGRTPQAVSNWKATGTIAPKTFLIMTAALARLGYRADPALWGMEQAEWVA